MGLFMDDARTTSGMAAFAALPRAFSSTTLLGALLVLAVSIAFLVPSGLYNIDEFVYTLGADTLSREGSLAVRNGWDIYGSEGLKLGFLREGPNGIVPQYPPGTALLAAPLFDMLGARSLILLNAISAALTVWMTYLLGRHCYGDARTGMVAAGILLFCTFLAEYAFGIWPHAMSMAAALGAFYMAVRATGTMGRRAFGWALAAGLAIGAGFLIRLDTILIVPVVGTFVILNARAPAISLAGGALGLLPGILGASLANQVKFGTFNPLSYGGGTGGGTDASAHAVAAVVGIVGVLALFAIRHIRWTNALRRIALASGLAAVALAFLHPALRGFAGDYARGLWDLGYDLTGVSEGRPGATEKTGPIRWFWGQPKKALAQSLPWLGILAIFLVRPWTAATRKWHLTFALALFVWSLPFVPRSWHGGFGMNMRYFLPVVPFLALLAAHAVSRLQDTAGLRARTFVLFGLLGFGAAALWAAAGPVAMALLHQMLTRVLFLIVAAFALWAALRGPNGPIAARSALASATVAFGVAAAVGAVQDFSKALEKRQNTQAIGSALASVEGPALLYGSTSWFGALIGRPDTLFAVPDQWTMAPDLALIGRALADGRQVFVSEGLAPVITDSDNGAFVEGRSIATERYRVVQIQPAPGTEPTARAVAEGDR